MCCFLEIGDRRYITAKIVFIHDDRFHSRLHPQFACMIFICSQSFINHFTGLFGTNIMNIFQLAVCSVDGALFKSEFFCCFFLRPHFYYCSRSVHYCEDRFHSRSAKDGEISHLGNVQTARRINSQIRLL